jgi:hypothetical protein
LTQHDNVDRARDEHSDADADGEEMEDGHDGDDDEDGDDDDDEEEDDADAAAQAMAAELGNLLWADISKAYSTPASAGGGAAVTDAGASTSAPAPSTPAAPPKPEQPEQRLVASIKRILDYLAKDAEAESLLGSTTVPQPSATSSPSTAGGKAKKSTARDLLSLLQNFSNTGMVDNETATSVADSLMRVIESPFFTSGSGSGAIDLPRNVPSDLVKMEDMDAEIDVLATDDEDAGGEGDGAGPMTGEKRKRIPSGSTSDAKMELGIAE